MPYKFRWEDKKIKKTDLGMRRKIDFENKSSNLCTHNGKTKANEIRGNSPLVPHPCLFGK